MKNMIKLFVVVSILFFPTHGFMAVASLRSQAYDMDGEVMLMYELPVMQEVDLILKDSAGNVVLEKRIEKGQIGGVADLNVVVISKTPQRGGMGALSASSAPNAHSYEIMSGKVTVHHGDIENVPDSW